MFRSAKWRLIAKTIPIMIVIVLAKLVVNAVHADVLTLSPLFSGIVAANFFLLGFLLAGTLTDFKEASVSSSSWRRASSRSPTSAAFFTGMRRRARRAPASNPRSR
jgi:hypothetical protein